MKSFSNECGTRNSFGHYDFKLGEVILKRPCFRKADLAETCGWLHESNKVKKLVIGYGATESCLSDVCQSNIYATARGAIKKDLITSAKADKNILEKLLPLVNTHPELHNLGLKCFDFAEDGTLFKLLLETVRNHPKLVHLDLTGCYFTDEQLVDLTSAIAQTYICSIVWPEPRMSQMAVKTVCEVLAQNKSVVVLNGVPFEMQEIAARNRKDLFATVRRPTAVGEAEQQHIKEYAESYRLAVAYEKQKLVEMEKTIESAIVL